MISNLNFLVCPNSHPFDRRETGKRLRSWLGSWWRWHWWDVPLPGDRQGAVKPVEWPDRSESACCVRTGVDVRGRHRRLIHDPLQRARRNPAFSAGYGQAGPGHSEWPVRVSRRLPAFWHVVRGTHKGPQLSYGGRTWAELLQLRAQSKPQECTGLPK